MTNSKTTKRALVLSAFAILMCVTMLIGTTFAWFTDTSSTAVNKIQSGSLKMKVEYSTDMTKWKEVDSETPIFDKETLWEPGHTEIVYFRVTNDGTLALRYDLSAVVGSYGNGKNAQGKAFALYNYLMFGSVDTETAFGTREDAIAAVKANEKLIGTKDIAVKKNEVVLPGEVSAISAMVLYMPTTVGNEANDANPNDSYIPYIEVGVTVNASQATKESDSFGTNYDEKAFAIFKPVEYSKGTHTIEESVYANGKWGAVAVNGGTTTINADVCAIYKDDAAVAVWADKSYSGVGQVIINGGTFTQEGVPSNNQCELIYAASGATIEINGGTFKAANPQWTLNCKDNSGSTITVKGGTFYKFDPSNANVGKDEIIVPAGYHVEQNGDWYTVVAD